VVVVDEDSEVGRMGKLKWGEITWRSEVGCGGGLGDKNGGQGDRQRIGVDKGGEGDGVAPRTPIRRLNGGGGGGDGNNVTTTPKSLYDADGFLKP